jgi:hypothetical protein
MHAHRLHTPHRSQLRELSAHNNSISGTLPVSLANLPSLQRLVVTSNQISGELGELLGSVLASGYAVNGGWTFGTATRWPEVEHLLLGDNLLSGTLPAAAGALSKLRALQLTRNSGLSGWVPTAFTASSEFESLQLSQTRISGALPTELGRLSGLQHLLADRTLLSGTVPSQLGACADLATLSLEFNRLSVRALCAYMFRASHSPCHQRAMHALVETRIVCACCIPARLPRTAQGTVPLELGGNCSKATEFELGSRPPEAVEGTNLHRQRSDPTDAPRGLQHPALTPHRRRTAAALRFRGNPGLAPAGPNSFAADLRDLSSADVCAYAAGPRQVFVATDGKAGGIPLPIEGSVYREPSPRAVSPADDAPAVDSRTASIDG